MFYIGNRHMLFVSVFILHQTHTFVICQFDPSSTYELLPVSNQNHLLSSPKQIKDVSDFTAQPEYQTLLFWTKKRRESYSLGPKHNKDFLPLWLHPIEEVSHVFKKGSSVSGGCLWTCKAHRTQTIVNFCLWECSSSRSFFSALPWKTMKK